MLGVPVDNVLLPALLGQLVLELGDQHEGKLHILDLDIRVDLDVAHLLHRLHDDPDVVKVKNLRIKNYDPVGTFCQPVGPTSCPSQPAWQ